jgi:hypothetical protein
MKNFNFSFGRLAGAVSCAAAFLFAAFLFIGCEDILKSVKEEIPLKTVSVTDEASLLAAVNDPLTGTIKVENSFSAKKPINVITKKTLVIPLGLTLEVDSITADADVYIVSDLEDGETADKNDRSGKSQALRLPAADSATAGVFLIKTKFFITEGVNFVVNEGNHLAFADENIESGVDGKLSVANQNAIYHLGTAGATLVLGGNGAVKVGDIERGVSSEGAFVIGSLPGSDEEGEDGEDEDEGADEGELPAEGDEPPESGDVPFIGDVQFMIVESNVKTEVDGVYDDNLNSVLAWINENGTANAEYVIRLFADQAVAPYAFPTGDDKAGIKITLVGDSAERKISWDGTVPESNNSGLFKILNNGTLTADNNITFDGKNAYIVHETISYPVFHIGEKESNGKVVMKDGSKITNLIMLKSSSRGVTINGNTGEFVMEGGEITGNNSTGTTSGASMVFGGEGGKFEMKGNAKISNNSNVRGLDIWSTSVITGGEISNNGGDGVKLSGTGGTHNWSNLTISNNGGWGIIISSTMTITITNVIITGNGGAVDVFNSTFTMNGGTISGNTGGMSMQIRASASGKFIMNGNVTIGNEFELVAATSASTPGGVIYLGSDFNNLSENNIVINLTGGSAPMKNTSYGWKKTDGKAFLKGGTPDSPVAVSNELFSKFTGGHIYQSKTTAYMDGTVSLTYNTTDGFGYAEWVGP